MNYRFQAMCQEGEVLLHRHDKLCTRHFSNDDLIIGTRNVRVRSGAVPCWFYFGKALGWLQTWDNEKNKRIPVPVPGFDKEDSDVENEPERLDLASLKEEVAVMKYFFGT